MKTINKMKGQSTEWEEMFANQISSKGLKSKIHKELLQHSSSELNNLMKKWART